MMIQEIKQGMRVRNYGGDVFEIMGTKGDLVIVKMLEHNSSLKPVNYDHEIFTPGEILEIDQISEIDMLLSGWYKVALEYLEPVEKVKEIEIPMFDKGDVVKDKFDNLYVIEDLVSPQQLEQDFPEYDHMGYRLKIIEKNPSSPARKVGSFYGFYSDDACMWIYNTFKDAVNDEVIVTDAHIFATELELYDEDESVAEDVSNESDDVPIFLVGDLVKDKFGNTFKVVDADKFEDFSDDCMHYNVELVIKHPDSPIRKAGGAAEFDEIGYHFWIYDTAEDAASRGVIVNDIQLLATELKLHSSEEVEGVEESDIPIFLEGDLVKDAFGNTFVVYEAKPSQRLDPDRFDYCNMGYRLKLVIKNPQSPVREVRDNVKFVEEGSKFWVYNREEDARAVEEYNPYTITASELVFVRSILQTEPVKPAKPAKAEIAKRYPSIEDLQKISEENDLGKLLDQAYKILKEQASLGERSSNLEAEKFKRCIPHFEREGFNVVENGQVLEIGW